MPRQHTERALSLRELNRSTLRRQLLLDRTHLSAPKAIAHLVGLQAQLARPPFVGLWSRLEDFTRDALAGEIERRTVVKASLMRSTLHLFTAEDYLALRGTLQPVMSSALEAILRERGGIQLDIEGLVGATRPFMHTQPRSFAEITTLLTTMLPDTDPGAMRYAVRTHLPMIQVPIDTAWCYPGNPKFALADDWLDRRVSVSGDRTPNLIKRYLAAFGPASAKDMETWSYLTNLGPAFDALRSELVVYRDARGREVFDIQDAPVDAEDTPAPVRFLPEFDNLLLAHQDRTRFVPAAARKAVYLPGLRIAATVLIDGFVGATWTSETVNKTATLRVVPLTSVGASDRQAIVEEAERLIRFVEPAAAAHRVEVADAGSPPRG